MKRLPFQLSWFGVLSLVVSSVVVVEVAVAFFLFLVRRLLRTRDNEREKDCPLPLLLRNSFCSTGASTRACTGVGGDGGG